MDTFKINSEFAKKYDKYRKAEELQKLKDRYGVDGDEASSSTSESEDDRAEAINSKMEMDFFKTMACLKRKDPVIYKKDEQFFDDSSSSDKSEDAASDKEKRKSSKPMLLKDYERDIVLHHNGMYGNDDVSDNKAVSGSYYAELNQIKKSFKEVTKKSDEADDEDELFRPKPLKEKDDKQGSATLEQLDDYWKSPDLGKDEKFLRDYILQKKYLEPEDSDVASSNDSVSEDDGGLFVTKQETFERKFNFRFEEPDTEFIKSYPRTVGDSVRRVDNKSKQKRKERKIRKEETKKKKMDELKRLKQLKREEIMEKISKLREATGNVDVKFKAEDISGDFDATEHDERMQKLFDEEFYKGDDEEKPEFSDLDDGEEPDWDQFECGDAVDYDEVNAAACEHPDFNMDCDFDATTTTPKQQRSKPTGGGKKHRKSAFYEAVAREKPVFDPETSTFDKYLEEYYAMDFEDLIGDMPCRFKYRKVPKQDFGLTTDEILSSDNRLLNSWCSLKHVVQHRTAEEEEKLGRLYARKARLKKKKHFVLANKADGESAPAAAVAGDSSAVETPHKKKNLNSKQRRRKRELERLRATLQNDSHTSVKSGTGVGTNRKVAASRTKENDTFRRIAAMNNDRLKAYGLKPEKILKKAKYSSVSNGVDVS